MLHRTAAGVIRMIQLPIIITEALPVELERIQEKVGKPLVSKFFHG